MLSADLLQAHILPRVVADELPDSAAAGLQRGYCWALHRQTLLLWKPEDGLQAAVRRLQLPHAPLGHAFVEVVAHEISTAVTVVLCTGSGQLFVWLDANFPAPPYYECPFTSASSSTAPDAVVSAMTASSAYSSSGLEFAAIIATADASLHLCKGTQSLIFTRQFYKPAALANKQAGVLGSLVGALRETYSLAEPLWFYNLQGVLLDALEARQVSVLAFTASTTQQQPQLPVTAGPQAGQGCIYICSTYQSKADTSISEKHEYAVTCLALQKDVGVVPWHRLSTAIGSGTQAPDAGAWHVVPHNSYSSCLLLAPGGDLIEWVLPPVAAPPAAAEPVPQLHLLGNNIYNMAIACTECSAAGNSIGVGLKGNTGGAWQLLNQQYGVLELAASNPDAEPQPSPGLMRPSEVSAALDLLDRTVDIMYREYSAGYAYEGLAEGLSVKLSKLGVFSTDSSGPQLLLGVSESLVDNLPKSGGSSGITSNSLRTALEIKQLRHDLLLAAYNIGDVLQQLQPQQCGLLFQHAEMLSAVLAVLDWQRATEAAAAAADGTVTQTQATAAAAAIEAAGREAAGSLAVGLDATGSSGITWEAFFSRPTASIPALFTVVASHAAGVRRDLGVDERSETSQYALQQLLGLAGVLKAVASGGQAKAAQLAAGIDAAVVRQGAAGLNWQAQDGAKEAWDELAEACLQLQKGLDVSERIMLAGIAHLPAVQALLSCYKDSLAAAAGQHAAALQQEYQQLAVRHGAALLQDAQMELEIMQRSGRLDAADRALTAGEGADEPSKESIAMVQGALVWQLESLAWHHKCHELLYRTCELLRASKLATNRPLLYNMQIEVKEAAGGVVGPGSFTFYVMERWRAAGDLSQLLQLGRQGFLQQLQQFLAPHPSLLWMTQVQSGNLSKATKTLDAAASAEQAAQGAGGAAAAVAAVEVLGLQPDQPGSEQYKQLWERSWQWVLRHSHLDQLSAALTAANEAGGGGASAADDFLVQLRSTPLYEAFIRAAEALVSASKAQANVTPSDILESVSQSIIAEVEKEDQAALTCVEMLLKDVVEQTSDLLTPA
eukprot:gene10954-11108_t